MEHVTVRVDWDHGTLFRYDDAWEVQDETGDASVGVRIRFRIDDEH
jgi:hypothetical protein